MVRSLGLALAAALIALVDAKAGGPFNLADLLASSIAADDLSPFLRGYVFAFASRPLQGNEITELNIPTGEPLVYDLGDDYRPLDDTPVEERYLRSPEEIRAAAEAVARQAGG